MTSTQTTAPPRPSVLRRLLTALTRLTNRKATDVNANRLTRLPVAPAALLVTMASTAFAQTQFTLEKRAPARTADRYGDLPLGAVIRTDERYSHDL